MPSVSIDVGYRIGYKDLNVVEHVTEDQPNKSENIMEAIRLLDETYQNIRSRLINGLSEEEVGRVMIMLPVPEKTVARVMQVVTDWQAEESV